MSYPFNVRVYGLLVWSNKILVSDEWIKGIRLTKFPGGGLEFGEGLKDGLVREIAEEIGVKAHSLTHFYTTDFFVESAWRTGEQVISIYYSFKIDRPDGIPVITTAFEGVGEKNREAQRWLDLPTATQEDLTLPIDRHVLKMLQSVEESQ